MSMNSLMSNNLEKGKEKGKKKKTVHEIQTGLPHIQHVKC